MTRDFLIIGGGIAGISAAARLSHLGTVTLLEAEDHFAHHASGRSAALFEPNYGLPPVVALSQASDHWLREANGGVLSPRGFMLVAGPEEEVDFRADASDLGLDPIGQFAATGRLPADWPSLAAELGATVSGLGARGFSAPPVVADGRRGHGARRRAHRCPRGSSHAARARA